MLSIALAGKPNAGKSTFYKAATLADVSVGDYPFTTIDPNIGIAYVRTACPCLELSERCGNDRCLSGKRYVPIELRDVAGLVPGAHEGRGLGNQFLDALMDADAIINVLDASGGTNEDGEPVAVGTYDPVDEAEFIESELVQWLTGIITRNWETVERQSRAPGFDIEESLLEMLSGLGATEPDIAACLRGLTYPTDPKQWSTEDRVALAQALRRHTKPILLVANKVDITPPATITHLESVGKPVVPATAEGELALRNGVEAGLLRYDPGDPDFDVIGELSESQSTGLETIREVMEQYDGTGIQRSLNHAAYDLLDYIIVYPVQNETRWTDGTGNVLPDAILLPDGSTPRDLAYAVHSDIGDGYLHAVNGRTNRRIGDEYTLADGDVIKIVSTAG